MFVLRVKEGQVIQLGEAQVLVRKIKGDVILAIHAPRTLPVRLVKHPVSGPFAEEVRQRTLPEHDRQMAEDARRMANDDDPVGRAPEPPKDDIPF